MAKLDLSKSPTQLIHELIISNNPEAANYKLLVDNIEAVGGITSAHVSDTSGLVAGYANITYTRIDLEYLFSLIEHQLNITDDVDKTSAVISEVLRKYNVAINIDDFTVEHHDNDTTITAKPENPSYIGSVTFSRLIPLSARVSSVVLNGFQLENNLRDIITIDTLPLYEYPEDYVEGKQYATCVTLAHSYDAIRGHLDILINGTLNEYDKVHEYFVKNDLPNFPSDLTFTQSAIDLEMDGVQLTTMLVSKPFVGEDWAGTIVIRY